MSSLIIMPSEFIDEANNVLVESYLKHLVAIYDDKDNNIGTGFLTWWNRKQVFVTAMHCLYGASFSEDPYIKQVHVDNGLVPLDNVLIGKILSNQQTDIAVFYAQGFDADRAIPYSALQFNKHQPDMITVVGYLARDFRRNRSDETLRPKPLSHSDKSVSKGSEKVAVRYLNRAISSDTGLRQLAPIPRGLSGTVMLNTTSLLLQKLEVYGVFTDEKLDEGYVFGSHVDKVQELLHKLDN